MRHFTTTGPVASADHYCIPPLSRLDLDDVLELVRDKKYFVLHAPRQTGKTSTLLALRELLNSGDAGAYRCVYVNVEAGQAAREDKEAAIRTILGELADEASLTLGDEFLDGIRHGILSDFGPESALRAALSRWARADPRPLVLLIDEIDALVGDALLSVLRQLRAGYARRPGVPTASPKASRCAGCATWTTIESTPWTGRPSSPAAAPSTSWPSRCAWATSRGPRLRRS